MCRRLVTRKFQGLLTDPPHCSRGNAERPLQIRFGAALLTVHLDSRAAQLFHNREPGGIVAVLMHLVHPTPENGGPRLAQWAGRARRMANGAPRRESTP